MEGPPGTIEDLLALTWAVEDQAWGVHTVHELVPGGDQLPVTGAALRTRASPHHPPTPSALPARQLTFHHLARTRLSLVHSTLPWACQICCTDVRGHHTLSPWPCRDAEENRDAYVDTMASYYLTDSVKWQFEAFARGFGVLCNGPALRLFNAQVSTGGGASL